MARNSRVSIAPVAAIGMIVGLILLGGIGFVGPFPFREIIFVVVCGIFASSILGIAVARRHRLKAVIGAILVSVLPSFGALVAIDLMMDDNPTLAMVIPGFLLVGLIFTLFAFAYPQPQEDGASPPKEREKGGGGRIIFEGDQMPLVFGQAQYVPNFIDPITKQSTGPDGGVFAVYPCPNTKDHEDELFFMSKASWFAKNFFCPRCATALLSDDWSHDRGQD